MIEGLTQLGKECRPGHRRVRPRHFQGPLSGSLLSQPLLLVSLWRLTTSSAPCHLEGSMIAETAQSWYYNDSFRHWRGTREGSPREGKWCLSVDLSAVTEGQSPAQNHHILVAVGQCSRKGGARWTRTLNVTTSMGFACDISMSWGNNWGFCKRCGTWVGPQEVVRIWTQGGKWQGAGNRNLETKKLGTCRGKCADGIDI